jgi:hypothetical protein
MHTPDSVETILARLMPPGLSDSGQRGIEAMLDELAAESPHLEIPHPATASPRMGWWIGGIAAAGVAAAWLLSATIVPFGAPVATSPAAGGTPAELVLVGESGRIESMIDEGWQEGTDGSAMRALRLNVVEENSLRDEETGIVMTVSEPREEILLMPISAF